MTKYKITATAHKPGNSPTNWVRYSPEKMTKTQCEKMLSVNKEVGVANESKVTLENFKCIKDRA